ncbi:MAG: bifunctional phosphoribosyl-AMP cyclohydrolase/phosphoribosyl-ATP diphosphatase HisIE [bacterium]
MNDAIFEDLKFNDQGLIPAIAQDVDSGEIRMLAYMNREAIKKTLETGFVHYYSRSRQQLWKKGETSGNLQEFVDMRLDCDGDTILVFIRQQGVACHTGKRNCFYRRLNSETESWEETDPLPSASFAAITAELEQIIAERDEQRPQDSYTTYLLEGADGKTAEDLVLEKLGEELTEVIIAAKNDTGDLLVEEIGDLFYHLLVLLRQKKIPLASLAEVLRERRG